MKSDFLVVIPARMASTRFPGKVLALLGGLPVVEWCRRAAVAADIGPVLIATDDAAVASALKPYKANTLLTSQRCACGSDRVWEVAKRRAYTDFPFVMNLQGDEPLISSTTIRRVAETLRRDPKADIATAVTPLNPKNAQAAGIVKVVLTMDRRCLYFSRSSVPSSRNGHAADPLWKHIGLYAYRRKALERFVRLPPSPLEKREGLEQLRALEAGMSIAASVVRDRAVAIDTPADLRRARKLVLGIR